MNIVFNLFFCSFCNRLSPHTTPPVERSSAMTLTLQEIILIGNVNDQVRNQNININLKLSI